MIYKKIKIAILFVVLLFQFCFAMDSATEKNIENVLEKIQRIFGVNIVEEPAFKGKVQYEGIDQITNREVYKTIDSEIYFYTKNNIIYGIDFSIYEQTELETKNDVKLIKELCLKHGYSFENEFNNERRQMSYYTKDKISVSIVTYNDNNKFFRLFFAQMKE